ncbi:MAG: alpha-2-macroglobulin family protein [Candidatus Binatia bacterium]
MGRVKWWAVVGALFAAAAAHGATVAVEQFSPQGTVKQIRQVTARFSAPMVPFGDLRDVAEPFAVDCAEPGTARWIDSRTWSYDFERDLPAGVRCRFAARADLRSLAGAVLRGQTVFEFSSGGPAIDSTLPGEGSERVDEEQVFVLALNGDATPDSVLAHAGFEVDGIAGRIGVELLDATGRDALLASLPYWLRPDGASVALKARQAFPNDSTLRLVWGAGIASPSGVVTAQDQVIEFKTRPRFTVKFSCERENAKADCIPLTPMEIAFSAPVPAALAEQVALVGPDGTPQSPVARSESTDFVTSLSFAPPFPESTTFQIRLPADLRDDAGRPLANLDDPTLTVKTAAFPPLAKFAARFGLLELEAEPALPVTIRNIDPDLPGQQLRVTRARDASLATRVRQLYDRLTGQVAHIPPEQPEQILPWLRRLSTARRNTSLFADPAALPNGETLKSFTLPEPDGAQAFQVVGIPFDAPGLYLVELASPRLGKALLDKDQPMYVPAAALVTNLAVHFKWARESALVWVTTLNDAQPVAGARVAVQTCEGTVLANGVTDAQGLARFSGLPEQDRAPRCDPDQEGFNAFDYREYYAAGSLNGLHSGLFVTAQTDSDLSFVHSSWSEGIESYRFRLPSEGWQSHIVARTIFDRPLFRAGDTVHMKHVLRTQTQGGFGLLAQEAVPVKAEIRHLGSNERFEMPVAFDAAGIATGDWQVPAAAKLGQYVVQLFTADNIPWDTGTFRVEQFRVPLMRATVQLPATPQVAAAALPVDIAVQYLAGGAAGELPVTLRAQIRPKELPTPSDFEHFTFATGAVREGVERRSDAEDESPAGEQKTGVHQRTELTLDASGTTRAEVTDLPPADTVREVLAEVEYRDPNGETQTAAATVPLWPAQWLPGIDAQFWAGAKDSVQATVAVIDPRGKPVASAPVQVDVFRRQFFSHRKRLVGGFYAYEHIEETTRIGPLCAGTTNPSGVFACRAAPPTDGGLILQATVTDADGRRAATNTEVYVSGEDDWGFPVQASDRMDVLPEKREYEPGETARLQVRMPFQKATALVTIEREGIGAAQVVQLSGNDPVVTIPVAGGDAPNTFISVLAVRGRVAGTQPTALVDLGKPAFRLGIAEIRVGWRDHVLNVDVTADREVYRVRDKATVRVAVRTAAGGAPPAGSEVALAAVDEGLLELLPNTSWNLLAAMMGRRGYDVDTATAQLQVIGKRHFGRKAFPHGGGGGRQSTRELFDTLLLWSARLPLDAQGDATVEVPLNDSLTSFRIAAVATGAVGQFGTGTTTIRSTQDLMLLAGLPPLVRQGDAFPAQFTLRNTTDQPLQVEARATVEGLDAPLPPQTVALAAGEARVIEWPITVPGNAERLKFLIEAAVAGGASDSLTVAQQVQPSVPVRVLQATLVHLEGALDQPLQRPADALRDRGGITVAAVASLGGATAGLDEWLRKYPYSCLEQQVSVAVGLRDQGRWASLMAALPSYADGDGLLKFFPTMTQGSEVLTAYVLSLSTVAGWALPPAVQERMIAGLRSFVDGSISRDSLLRAPDRTLRKLAAIDALARAGAFDPAQLESLSIEPNLWPTSAVLDWWSIVQRASDVPDRDARLAAVEQIVRARLNLQGTTMGFSTERGDELFWLMTSSDTNAVRLILHLVEFGLWKDDVPRLLRGTLGRQERGAWSTTVANAWGALAMARFAAAFEAVPVTGTTGAALAGATQTIDWAAQPPLPTLAFPWPAERATLRIAQQGTGTPWVTISSRAAIPLTAPLSSGYRITKTITPLEPQANDHSSRGDRLRVRLEVEAQADMTWVVVDDPIPTGSGHLGTGMKTDAQIGTEATDEGAAPDFVERRFDAYRAYFQFMPKGRTVLEYVIRLNQSGRFELPPTRVEALYAPEMFGESPNAAVEVAP